MDDSKVLLLFYGNVRDCFGRVLHLAIMKGNRNMKSSTKSIKCTKYTKYQQSTKRSILIGQFRHALYLAESPKETVVEFEIGDVGFCFDFSK